MAAEEAANIPEPDDDADNQEGDNEEDPLANKPKKEPNVWLDKDEKIAKAKRAQMGYLSDIRATLLTLRTAGLLLSAEVKAEALEQAVRREFSTCRYRLTFVGLVLELGDPSACG